MSKKEWDSILYLYQKRCLHCEMYRPDKKKQGLFSEHTLQFLTAGRYMIKGVCTKTDKKVLAYMFACKDWVEKKETEKK